MMTLRQRIDQWRERDRIVSRKDLSIADKVGILQGNLLEPMNANQTYTGEWFDAGPTPPVLLLVSGGPVKVECECGKMHVVYPSFVKPHHITAAGRLRRTPSCDNREE